MPVRIDGEWTKVADVVKQVAFFLEEEWPEVIAWLVVGSGPAWLLYVVVVRRPRSSAAGAFLWSAWLCMQVSTKGSVALEATKSRALVALQATHEVVQKSVVMVEAWIVVFLPFVADLWRHSRAAWTALSSRARIVLVGVPIGTYLTVWAARRVVRACRRRREGLRKAAKSVLFHGSFILACPLLWYLTGRVSASWLHLLLANLLTTVPTIGSLLSLGWQPLGGPKNATGAIEDIGGQHESQLGQLALPWRANASPSGEHALQVASNGARRRRSQRRAVVDPPSAVPASPSSLRLWLAYWASWPVLRLAEQGLPALLEFQVLGVKEVAEAQAKLRRALIVYVFWLLAWKGSRLQLEALRSTLARCRLLEFLPGLLGAHGLHVLNVLRGGTEGVPLPSRANMFIAFQNIFRRGWRILAAGTVATLLLVAAVILFYRLINITNRALTVLIWIFAAVDTADTLAADVGDILLARKLAFWAVAMLWSALVQLPFLGAVLRLLTPVVFALLMVASETILRRVVQPLLEFLTARVRRLLSYLGWTTSRTTAGACKMPFWLLRCLFSTASRRAESNPAPQDADADVQHLQLPDLQPVGPGTQTEPTQVSNIGLDSRRTSMTSCSSQASRAAPGAGHLGQRQSQAETEQSSEVEVPPPHSTANTPAASPSAVTSVASASPAGNPTPVPGTSPATGVRHRAKKGRRK